MSVHPEPIVSPPIPHLVSPPLQVYTRRYPGRQPSPPDCPTSSASPGSPLATDSLLSGIEPSPIPPVPVTIDVDLPVVDRTDTPPIDVRKEKQLPALTNQCKNKFVRFEWELLQVLRQESRKRRISCEPNEFVENEESDTAIAVSTPNTMALPSA
ncbi:hypothetical protein IFM89_014018 [Coptis chinensis]|uniref:Uncharacterized protein n=1 Tax=Coptis chinensis TaxID=261450 RepID=A0A835IPY6_9MAGN|nr:hypothetical protein IFM89_014018 [Coptis chinensis]